MGRSRAAQAFGTRGLPKLAWPARGLLPGLSLLICMLRVELALAPVRDCWEAWMVRHATQPTSRSGNNLLKNLGFGGVIAQQQRAIARVHSSGYHSTGQTGLDSWSVEGPRIGIGLPAEAGSLPREAPG